MKRFVLLSLLVSSLAAIGHAQTVPNIVIILADDLGIADVGTYGPNIPDSDPALTPFIDQLTTAGVQFNHAWSNPVCSPTRATILTGRYGAHTGVGIALEQNHNTDLGELLAPENTLPELLVASYTSAVIGKWHLGKFNEGNDSPRIVGGFQLHSGLVVGEINNYKNWELYVNGSNQGFITTYATTKNVDDALTWINQQQGPWLLYLAFNAPHKPFHVPPKSLLSKQTGKVLQQLGIQTMNDCDLNSENQRLCFKAAIEAMDKEIARLFIQGGITTENTVIFFIGDNGTTDEAVPFNTFPAGKSKGTVYEGGVRVPLIVAGPPDVVISLNREVNHPVNIADVFATVLEIAGATIPAGTDSVSLMPYLQTPLAVQQRNYVYTEKFDGGIGVHSDPNETGIAAIFDGVYKVIEEFNESGIPEMIACFDLNKDEFEQCNLLAQPLDPVLCPHATGTAPPECQALYDTMEADLH
ncbi:sulfatase-like hydrolase/transferase [bacterium]|nr:sulfatase-like hydrolase/transferase [bacterium]